MTTEKIDPTIYGFPPKLSQPATQALLAAGYTRLEQLTETTAADVLKLHGMGPKGIRMLREELTARGLAFAPDLRR
jgi:hypothetical protein